MSQRRAKEKLTERRDTADVSELLKILHRIVNQAIATQAPGGDQASEAVKKSIEEQLIHCRGCFNH